MGLIDRLAGAKEEREVVSIAKHLSILFNAKREHASVVTVYGLGSFDTNSSSKARIEALRAEMEALVERFERRLEKPKVSLLGRDAGLWVRFVVQGKVGGEPQGFSVRYHAVLRNVEVEPIL